MFVLLQKCKNSFLTLWVPSKSKRSNESQRGESNVQHMDTTSERSENNEPAPSGQRKAVKCDKMLHCYIN